MVDTTFKKHTPNNFNSKHFYTKTLPYEEFFKLASVHKESKGVCWTQIYWMNELVIKLFVGKPQPHRVCQTVQDLLN